MELYHTPANIFVARFIGSPSMNTVPCTVEAAGAAARVKPANGASVKVPVTIPDEAVGKPATFGVRPEDLELRSDGHGIPVTVDVVEELGADAYIYGLTKAAQHVDEEDSDAPEKPFIARVDGRKPPQKGETIFLAPKTGHVHLFDAQTGLRLGD